MALKYSSLLETVFLFIMHILVKLKTPSALIKMLSTHLRTARTAKDGHQVVLTTMLLFGHQKVLAY